MRKTLSLILAFLLALTLAPPALAAASPFTDVPSAHWAHNEIMEAYADGAVNGVSANRYSPDGNVTMAQFIAILTRAYCADWLEHWTENAAEFIALNGYEGLVAGEYFMKDAWYAPNYEAASEYFMFDNIPNNNPETEVTREVMAQIMYNLMLNHMDGIPAISSVADQNLSTIKSKIPDFSSVSESMKDAVSACYSLGLITGIDSTGRFSPQGRMTRAQTAVIYVRLKQVMETGEGLANQTGTSTGTSGETTGATLTNGKPVTVDNVLALIEEYKNGKAPVWEKAIKAGFTSYADRAKYDAYNPKYYLAPFGSGTECAKFAFAFWDELFGDLPMREFKNPEDVRPGDLLQYAGHWSIAVTSASTATFDGELRVWTVDGGSMGKIAWSTVPGWIGGDKLIGIYTRYPQ